MNMNKENCKKKDPIEGKTTKLTIRVTPSCSRWMNKNNYSPTGIFYEALNNLGYNNTTTKNNKK